MKNNLLKNYIYNICIVFTSILFPVLFFPYSSRVLTPYYYGKYNFALSIINYFVIIANLGIPTYGIRELTKSKLEGKENFKKSFSEIFLISIFSSILSFILLILSLMYFDKLREEYLLLLIIGMTVLFSFSTLDYFFIATENHKRRTIRLLIVRTISLIFLFTIVKEPKDYLKFALIMTLPEVIAKMIDFITVRKYLFLKIKSLNFRKHLKPLVIIFFYVISTNIYLNLDSTMIGVLKGDREVGYYSVAVKMTKIFIPIVTSLGLVLAPRMIEKIKNKDKENLFKDMDLYLNFIFFITLPIVGLLYILAENVVLIFSGDGYRNSILTMKVMLPVITFISLSGFSAAQILIPSNREDIVFKVSLIGLISNFTLNFLLIPKYGILGAGIATLISELLVCIFRFLGVKKLYREYKMFSVERINYILATLVSFIIANLIKNLSLLANIYIELIFVSSVFGIVYLTILLLRKEFFITMGIKKIIK